MSIFSPTLTPPLKTFNTQFSILRHTRWSLQKKHSYGLFEEAFKVPFEGHTSGAFEGNIFGPFEGHTNGAFEGHTFGPF